MTKHRLTLRQLSRKFRELERVRQLPVPAKGWIHEIRSALGMSVSQLARRLGVSQSAVTQQQKNEVCGAITIGTLRETAAALECDLVYTLVPRADLGVIRERQARIVAERAIKSVVHSMGLERQQVSDEETSEQVEDLVRELLEGRSRSLWSEP